MGSAAEPVQPQSPVHAWLLAVYSNSRARVITRKSDQGWIDTKHAWTLDCIAKAVYGLSQVVGLRPEGRVRVITVDIDRKPDRVSRYWHPYGQSRQLQALEREAVAVGCSFTIVRSSASGGLHCLIQLPVAVRAWEAYWIGLELISRAGMEEASGQAELFPSRINYSASTDPSTWAQSHGCRLPGQEGSALLMGDRLETDTDTIYGQLLQALQYTEALPAWDELLQAAADRRKPHKEDREPAVLPRRFRRATQRRHGVVWTGPGQSHDNLARITTWARAAHPDARTVEELAPIIRSEALNAPGFAQHASVASRADVQSSWPERWARSSLRRDRVPGTPTPKGSDPHHNRRLLLQSRAALTRLWKSIKNSAELSQRRVAELTGLNRKNVRRHWDYWLQLLGGPHPSLTGGGVPSAVSSSESQSLSSVSPTPSVEAITAAVHVTSQPKPPPASVLTQIATPAVSPFRLDARPLDQWRERQRAELLAWIGAA